MSDIYRLVYSSRRAAACGEADIVAILDASRRNNARDGLTGALMVAPSGFAQVLEGPRRAIEEAFERIEMDDRHDGALVLSFEPIDGRAFAGWAMAFAVVDDTVVLPVDDARAATAARLVSLARSLALSREPALPA